MVSEAIIALAKYLVFPKIQSKAVFKIALVSTIIRKAISLREIVLGGH